MNNSELAIPPSFDLTGRVCIVTGAGSATGIGFTSAALLGRMGATVLVASTSDRIKDRVSELGRLGVVAAGYIGDLTEPASAEGLICEAVTRWNRLDVLINNAGMVAVSGAGVSEFGSTDEMSLDAWHAALRRNLDTAFLVTKAALPVMCSGGWGRVVMMSSFIGPVLGMYSDVAYSTAKAGLLGFTRSVALDVAASGVTVNAVAPGWIATGSQLESDAAEGKASPVGRNGTPEEVASAIIWLASPGASYVTGECIVIDGGTSISARRATCSSG